VPPPGGKEPDESPDRGRGDSEDDPRPDKIVMTADRAAGQKQAPAKMSSGVFGLDAYTCR
jgi:hypothetical protein